MEKTFWAFKKASGAIAQNTSNDQIFVLEIVCMHVVYYFRLYIILFVHIQFFAVAHTCFM